MELGSELRLAIVAATVEDSYGDAVFNQGAKEDFVAALDFPEGEVHLAEAVVAVVIGAGDPDDEVWGEFVEGVGEGVEKLLEVHLALDVTDSLDVEGAVNLFRGIIFPYVDGVGENAWVIAEE